MFFEETPLMTYCVALRLRSGMVMLSDTRTNAGVDNVSQFKKMFTWENPGERAICMMTSGNLSITQGVVSLLQENIDHPKEGIETLFTAESMYRVAEIVGDAMAYVQNRYGAGLAAAGESGASSIILSGQRVGGVPRMFLIYSAGNFIEATEESCFFQVGEHKYGKPILDRVIGYDSELEDGLIAVLLSMDSTLRSNLSVGMPLDLSIIRTDEYQFDKKIRIQPDDEDFRTLSDAWSGALRNGFTEMRKLANYL